MSRRRVKPWRPVPESAPETGVGDFAMDMDTMTLDDDTMIATSCPTFKPAMTGLGATFG